MIEILNSLFCARKEQLISKSLRANLTRHSLIERPNDYR